ncbi:hypothetical protein BH09BAC5_BH09BAC5_19920 [soil metagenome]
MKFEPIEPFLAVKGLSLPDLEVLRPDETPYTTAIFQPISIIETSKKPNPFLHSREPEIFSEKFKKFFQLVNQNHCDLAVAPEYSLPWACLHNLLSEKIVPQKKSLWVSGCESITPKELFSFIEGHKDVVWIHEEYDVECTDHFLDIACHLFHCPNNKNQEHSLVAVLQFKTHQLGSTDFERDVMIEGSLGYIFKNEGNSIRLATIICSDALDFSMDDLGADIANHLPLLLLHLQLTPDYRTPNFTDYRHRYFNTIRSENCKKEFLCVNWAKGTEILNHFTFIVGGSAHYGRFPKSVDQSEKVNHNELLGAYYTFWGQSKATSYYFSFDEHIFIWENDKIDQTNAPAQNFFRRGIKMLNSFTWDIENRKWQSQPNFKCGLLSFCQEHFGKNGVTDLFVSVSNQVDKERFLAISIGGINNIHEKPWFEPEHHIYFQVDNREIISRTTFDHEFDSNTIKEKIFRLSLIRELGHSIQNNHLPFPHNISDLEGKSKLNYSAQNNNVATFYNNLFHSENVAKPAIGCYVGISTESYARIVYCNVRDSFKKNLREQIIRKGTDDDIANFPSDQSILRIVVWYKENDAYKFIGGPLPEITDKRVESTSSFKRTK